MKLAYFQLPVIHVSTFLPLTGKQTENAKVTKGVLGHLNGFSILIT